MAKESKILPTPEQIAKYGPDVVISVSFLSYTHISQLLFN